MPRSPDLTIQVEFEGRVFHATVVAQLDTPVGESFDRCAVLVRRLLTSAEQDASSEYTFVNSVSAEDTARVPNEAPEAAASGEGEVSRSSWDLRLAHAQSHGECAARVLSGLRYEPPATIPGLPKNTIWVLLRDASGVRPADGYSYFYRWSDIAEHVQVQEGGIRGRKVLGEQSVFKAFASHREAAAYLRGANINTLPLP